jgi:GxxExxY protein
MNSFQSLSLREEQIGRAIVNAAFRVHKELGPGLLEKVYETCLAYELRKDGYFVERQLSVPILYDDMLFDEGFRLDMRVEQLVIVETKAVEEIRSVWMFQVLTHLKLMDLRLGYLINFNVPVIRDGIKRYIR